MKKILLLTLILGTSAFWANCSLDRLAGGGTESTNGCVIGTLMEEDSTRRRGTGHARCRQS